MTSSHSCNRRILLCVTGLSPQIVTETLYTLAVVQQPAWVPDEIHLLTTATGAREARLNLLTAETGWFHRLRADYGLPEIVFGETTIHVLKDAAGVQLDDIRTPNDNECAADFITDIVRGLTRNEDMELHVSIAGGRKTMGYYLGYALSLYGRPHDRLSHVLVSDPYESNRAFYYPTPYQQPISVRRSDKEQTFDARDARVVLAQIPFVRLREGLPNRLRDGEATFSNIVSVANRGQLAPRLVLQIGARVALMDGEVVPLSPVEYAVLLWLAERTKRNESAVDWSLPASADEFLNVVKCVLNPDGGVYERVAEAIEWRKDIAIKLAKYFEPHKTRINNAIEAVLGQHNAARYAIRRIKTDNGQRYDLQLKSSQIEIKR